MPVPKGFEPESPTDSNSSDDSNGSEENDKSYNTNDFATTSGNGEKFILPLQRPRTGSTSQSVLANTAVVNTIAVTPSNSFYKTMLQPVSVNDLFQMNQLKTVAQMKAELEQASGVKVLSMGGDELDVRILGDAACKSFFNVFAGNIVVKKLKLRGPEQKDAESHLYAGIEGWQYLSPCFVYVQELSLQHHKIDMGKAYLLVDAAVLKNPFLEHLDLWNDHLDEETALFVMQNIVKHKPSLKHVNLGENNLDSEVRLSIKRMIKKTALQVEYF